MVQAIIKVKEDGLIERVYCKKCCRLENMPQFLVTWGLLSQDEANLIDYVSRLIPI